MIAGSRSRRGLAALGSAATYAADPAALSGATADSDPIALTTAAVTGAEVAGVAGVARAAGGHCHRPRPDISQTPGSLPVLCRSKNPFPPLGSTSLPPPTFPH